MIAFLLSLALVLGNEYQVKGTVTEVHDCICPEGALCKPCGPETITISVENEELRAYVADAGEFEVGKGHSFDLRVINAADYDSSGPLVFEVVSYK